MIIFSYSNIDIIQGNIGYGNVTDGITDWRISNTSNGIIGSTGIFNIFNSSSTTANLSIIDNGNIGIGTTPQTSSSKLEIIGNINISGNYKINNRDIINDTSNYVLTTSNLLIPRIITDVGHGSNYLNRINSEIITLFNITSNYAKSTTSNIVINPISNSQWTNSSSGIYYAPTAVQSLPNIITSSPIATINGIVGTDRYISFTYTTDNVSGLVGQTQYTFTTTETLICDILIVGGGGGGGARHCGGGGAGAVIYLTNQTLSAGTYTINVGNGGTGSQAISGPGAKGIDSSITFNSANIYLAKGGGAGDNGNIGISDITNGGSGGGAYLTVGIAVSTNIPTGIYGNSGGLQTIGGAESYFGGGGGGGALTIGANAVISGTTTTGGNGGYGREILITGSSVYYGGGGGGGIASTANIAGQGGLGGGGAGSKGAVTATNGTPGTGGGGGGSGFSGGTNGIAGNGGSGIVIIRYRNIPTTNVGIGITYPTSKLHINDDTIINTRLTVQNNYIDTVVIAPNTTGYTVAETYESNKYYRTLTFNYFPNYPEDPPNTALLAWWRLNGDGLDYNPYVTKYNLTNSGTPTYSTGITADSFFQGRRYINTGTGSLITSTLGMASRAFSISVWVRVKVTTDVFFITHGTGNLNTGLWIGARANNGYCLAFYYNDLECGQGVTGNPTSYPGDKDNWVHIVYVVLSNFNRRIYRNGILISTDTNTSAFVGSGNFTIGNVNVDISDFRIYNNGLSAAEVTTLYNSYINLVVTDNYSLNFKNSTSLLVNSVSKTVSGAYNISMGNINSSMLPASGQSDIPLASTAITSIPIKYEYSNSTPTLPVLITVAGATSSIIGTTERCISFTYTTDSSGLTGQTLYTFTPTEDIWCDILIVGGGGGGGKFGGGGGGGAVLFGTNLKLKASVSVSVKVGNGGNGAITADTGVNGINGSNSSIIINTIEYIAIGGGGGGSRGSGAVGTSGNAGGCGGGGSHANSGSRGLGGISNKNMYANFQSFGNNGGAGRPHTSGSEPTHASGGGGGSGSNGSDFSYTRGGGNGGKGIEFISYFGTNVGHFGYFAGGGGGNTYAGNGNRGYGNGGLGLYGGGGNGGYDGTLEYSADDGFVNTGGGGGGAKWDGTTSGSLSGGKGGSGFVIIRYRKNISQSSSIELISRGAVSEISITGATTITVPETLDRCITFPYSGSGGSITYTFNTTDTLNCDILIVGGGGNGGNGENANRGGGGGGAGGLIYIKNISLIGTYTITVGKNENNSSITTTATNQININGNLITSLIALGGGRGGTTTSSGAVNGISGGSGGGGADFNGVGANSTQNTYFGTGFGFKGGNSFGMTIGSGGAGAGGGGAGGVGANQDGYTRGLGGPGKIIDITGTPIEYAVGGNGSTIWSNNGFNGINNRGNGGAGAGRDNYTGGTGGTGIVIIRYRNTNSKISYKIGNYNGDFKILSSTYSSYNTSADTEFMRITRDGNSIYNPTGSPQWSTVSDRRIKENIEIASYDKCYESVKKLELYRFNYIKELNNINKDINQLGYIAQEVKDIFPKAVSSQEFHNDNLSISDMLSIDIAQINYSLYGAVKKLIELYNNKLERLKKLKRLLNIDNDTSNIVIDSNTNNINIYGNTSNISIIDNSISNIMIIDNTSINISIIDNSISNISIIDNTSINIAIIDNSISNISIIDNISINNIYYNTSNIVFIDI
jgi:hypothetical protein